MNRLFAAGCLFLAIGCGGPAPIPQAGYSPSAIASAAMAKHDANKDGKLDANELKQCPSIAFGLAEIDADNNKAVSADELQARVQAYVDSKVSLRDGVDLRVVRGAKGAGNVTITLVPEEFMAGSVQPATGVTQDFGTAQYKTDGQPYPGVQPGFYKVVLSLKDSSQKETLPARFNSATVHGIEVGPSNRIHLSIDLEK